MSRRGNPRSIEPASSGLLHHSDVGTAFTDFNRVAAGIHRAAGREDCDGAGLLRFLCGGPACLPADSSCGLDCRYDGADRVPRHSIVVPDRRFLILSVTECGCSDRIEQSPSTP